MKAQLQPMVFDIDPKVSVGNFQRVKHEMIIFARMYASEK